MLPAAPSPLVSIHTTSPPVAHLGAAAGAAVGEVVAASEATGISATAAAAAAVPMSRLGERVRKRMASPLSLVKARDLMHC
jgi:hypothetical protein